MCGSEQYSPWVKHTVVLDPYWTDIVTTQPSGYIVDAEGNVEISSAEGLAWMSVLVNGFHGHQPNSFEGKTVRLTTDINLNGYRWYPMGRYMNWEWTLFSGTFDGQGHTISNIYVRDDGSNLGLFGYIQKARIKNVKMNGGSVSSTLKQIENDPQYWLPSSCVGGLVGQAYLCYEISNCQSSVDVYGNGGAGSLCGDIHSYGENVTTMIFNCAATGNVTGRESCGGLIGNVFGDVVISNCYAMGNVNIIPCDFSAWEMGRGGLVGGFRERASIYNCFSVGTVYSDSYYYHPIGKLIGYADQNSTIQLMFALDNNNQDLDLIGSGSYDTEIIDTVNFHHSEYSNILLTPVEIGGSSYTGLIDALNAWIIMKNNPNLKTWVLDSISGFPVFGENHVPSC
jgi:hypothetical protein